MTINFYGKPLSNVSKYVDSKELWSERLIYLSEKTI